MLFESNAQNLPPVFGAVAIGEPAHGEPVGRSLETSVRTSAGPTMICRLLNKPGPNGVQFGVEQSPPAMSMVHGRGGKAALEQGRANSPNDGPDIEGGRLWLPLGAMNAIAGRCSKGSLELRS